MDLRAPNRDALASIAGAVSHHYEVQGESPPFEAVVISATGVGKTYVLAATIEYFASVQGVRNFAVIVPGRTILEKTVRNFTPGHAKSLLGAMSVQPVVITSENFATPTARADMDDPERVKLYIFTVQSLIRPDTQQGRRTHKFQEGLGAAFYEHLSGLGDLFVFADEHHCYYGPAFSDAIRNLRPYALIGLTATPHRRTPGDQVIYRYPLAAAIADRLVKTPVLVGRKDDRTDAMTKLSDGARLLELKADAMERWCAQQGLEPVRPVMLVVAQTIEEAKEYGEILASEEFHEGRYAGAVLVVTSDSPDEALALLERVEEPTSPVRVIVSVGMLKEGWDVKNIYVIASMRASVSDILTEQTLGRGLRMPFGAYTAVELLDTLEVVAHERYQELLRRAGVINDTLIDYRVRFVLRQNAQGQVEAAREQSEVRGQVIAASTTAATAQVPGSAEAGAAAPSTAASFLVADAEAREKDAEATAARLRETLKPRPGTPRILVPILRMKAIDNPFSLADITDLEPFRRLGRQLALDPQEELRRTLVSARVIMGTDGLKRTQLVTSAASDRIVSQGSLLPLDGLLAMLTDHLLHAPFVPARREERAAAAPIIQAFLDGLDGEAEKILSAYFGRASARLLQAVAEAQRRFAPKPSLKEVVGLRGFSAERNPRPVTSFDRTGEFKRGVGYLGWRRSMYDQAWFDSSPERDVANILDEADEVTCWVRLHHDDLPILWSDAGQWYHPDFLVVEAPEVHWVLEVKAAAAMRDTDVQAKREAAQRWANHVSADASIGVPWRYLLVSESDVQTAKGSWSALKRLGGG
ncbi:MAG: DEAD/DEAH box helicase family protein [Nitrospiraceae bacterium]|nr:DEAD/DEAH box helicase family protein [Nitrospiraceae bacterium]